MSCCQMGSEMVLECSAPSPDPGHSATSRAIQHPAKELDSECNPKENSCGRELTVTEEDSPYSLIHLLKKKKEAQEMEKGPGREIQGEKDVWVLGHGWESLWFFGGFLGGR